MAGKVVSRASTLENKTCVPHSALFMVYFDSMVTMSLCLAPQTLGGFGNNKVRYNFGEG